MIAKILGRFGYSKPIPTRLQVTYDRIPIRNGMTYEKWLKDPSNVRAANELLHNPTFQDMLSIVKKGEPAGFPRSYAATDIQSATELGRIQGYKLALSTLYALAEYPEERKPDVEADYGASELETTTTPPQDE